MPESTKDCQFDKAEVPESVERSQSYVKMVESGAGNVLTSIEVTMPNEAEEPRIACKDTGSVNFSDERVYTYPVQVGIRLA